VIGDQILVVEPFPLGCLNRLLLDAGITDIEDEPLSGREPGRDTLGPLGVNLAKECPRCRPGGTLSPLGRFPDLEHEQAAWVFSLLYAKMGPRPHHIAKGSEQIDVDGYWVSFGMGFDCLDEFANESISGSLVKLRPWRCNIPHPSVLLALG
jgi:hypothetical protein